MKTVNCLLVLVVAGTFTTASAQISKDAYKRRSEMMGLNKKLQSEKVEKGIRKQAKDMMQKEGWKVAPGGLPLEQQIERSTLYQNSFEDDMVTPKFVWGDASATAEFYDAGKMQALALARENLIGSIETNITQLVEINRSNKQLNSKDAASVAKTLSASKSFITQKLGQTIPVIEVYRELPNGNVQVRVQTFYSMDKAREIAKQVIREQMEQSGDEFLGKLDDLLD
ncbi:MAG: hypothetical protein K2J84_00055 [Bacteroidaceae bacterium]|nr:hypothetical protein [Bacteroidaceae bacterium]